MQIISRKNFSCALVIGLMLFAGAAHAESGLPPMPETVTVSINAGETYVIDNIKDGSTPSVRVVKNPGALVTSNATPGKLVLIGAEAGHWIIGMTNNAGRALSYDVSVASIAIPGAPLSAGKTPPSLSDGGLGARVAALRSPAAPISGSTSGIEMAGVVCGVGWHLRGGVCVRNAPMRRGCAIGMRLGPAGVCIR